MKGITLILAVFVSSLALTLGLGIFTLLFSELEFSGSARESVLAFYAADGGIECAIFWDIETNAFATSTTSSITCDEDTFTVGGPSGISRFTIPFNDGSCADVEVTKSNTIVVISQGKNICADSPKTVQRGLRVSY
ncbi:MAG: hypothetical protein AAB522_02615 [Patescibacteria group bacterium]